MEQIRPARNRVVHRSMFGLVTYCALNFAVLAAEARWHVLTKLTLYDVAQIKTLLPMIARLLHHS
ncbi:MAG TPA: hypothetical protein VGG70_02415 [Candidatus Cybelea sp.]